MSSFTEFGGQASLEKSRYDEPTALLEDLDRIKNATNLPYERRLCDAAIWFHKNKSRISKENIPARVLFLEKSVDVLLELFALSLERLYTAENRVKSSSLILPR